MQKGGESMNPRGLTEKVRKVAAAAGADLVGVAGVDRFHKAPSGRSPADHLPTAESVVVVARKIPDAAIDRWGKSPANAITSYRTYGHGPINMRLVFIIQDIASCLEEEGYEAYPVTPLGGRAASTSARGGSSSSEGREFFADFSNRHAAVAAGLGEFGWSSIVLTPEYGPRQRFASLFTDAPLEPDPMYDGPTLCSACHRDHPVHPCASACPVKAISLHEEVGPIEIGDRRYSYARVDHWRCFWSEVEGLIKEAGPMYDGMSTDVRPPELVTPEAVLEARGLKDPWQTTGFFGDIGPWCGRCLHVCVYGRDTHDRRLQRRRNK
jgi:epoxyqueuosine reductase QueG